MKVCIIGQGLSSLALAKALINQNINVDLLSSKKKYALNKSRTIGISKSSLKFINNNIINIEKDIWKLKRIEIYSENLANEKLLYFENDEKEIFSIIKNYQFLENLKKSLLKSKNFKILNLKKNLNELKKYDLVINTDQFNFITKKYFYKKIEKEYNATAYTTIIKHKKIQNKVAVQIFTEIGPLAFLPISETETSIVYSIQKSKNKTNDKIISLIHKYNLKYKILDIKKIVSFKLKSFLLRSYYHNNILSFGDLLHKIHPLAGQGFNMTIRDIKVLLDIIKNKQLLGLPFDKSIGIEFEKKTKHKNFIFSNGIDLIQQFFDLERKTNNKALSKSVKFIGQYPSINKFFSKIADRGFIS
tara:strand:+ start:1005 stop:2081 length:1077 start_codon:yes stop_codon:yes gene_type:complete